MYNDEKLKIYRKNLRNNMPHPEQVIWYYLRNRQISGYKFRRQYSIGKYILDFYCTELKLAIEIDGDSHFSQVSSSNDQIRTQYLMTNKIQVLRFDNMEINTNIFGVLSKIVKYLP
jgi:very-short-patch-repair endonuclease